MKTLFTVPCKMVLKCEPTRWAKSYAVILPMLFLATSVFASPGRLNQSSINCTTDNFCVRDKVRLNDGRSGIIDSVDSVANKVAVVLPRGAILTLSTHSLKRVAGSNLPPNKCTIPNTPNVNVTECVDFVENGHGPFNGKLLRVDCASETVLVQSTYAKNETSVIQFGDVLYQSKCNDYSGMPNN